LASLLGSTFKDHRPQRLLGAPLPGHSQGADAPLSAPQLAGRSEDRRATCTQGAQVGEDYRPRCWVVRATAQRPSASAAARGCRPLRCTQDPDGLTVRRCVALGACGCRSKSRMGRNFSARYPLTARQCPDASA
jgi:hypothetical protein